MTMIEKVARALCNAEGVDPDRKGNERDFRWQEYERDARAAIEAMQEPTQAMINAGSETYIVDGAYGIDDVDLSIIYQTMIHTAIKENLS